MSNEDLMGMRTLLRKQADRVNEILQRWNWDRCQGSDFPPTERDALQMVLGTVGILSCAMGMVLEKQTNGDVRT